MTEKRFPAALASFEDARSFLEEELDCAEVPMKASMQIMIAFEEMFVNVCHYAYPGTEGEILVRLAIGGGAVTVELVDEGVPFDPLARPEPDVTLSAEERSVGGLGIFMVRKSMDEVNYAYKDGRNHLTMVKKI